MKIPLSFVLAATLLLAWIFITHQLSQPIWATERGRDLMSFGAAKGSGFQPTDWWRIFTCQWLHMKLPHLVLNAVFIVLLGASVEKIAGKLVTLVTYVVSGTAGVVAEMLLSPTLVVSGASQAMLGLTAFVLIAVAKSHRANKGFDLSIAMLAIVCSITLDLCYGGSLKIGHVVGFLFGAAFGLIHHATSKSATHAPTSIE